jgi:hypothetical protein
MPHIQIVLRLNFSGLPRGDKICADSYSDIIAGNYRKDLTCNPRKGAGRSQSRIFQDNFISRMTRDRIGDLFEFNEGTVLVE